MPRKTAVTDQVLFEIKSKVLHVTLNRGETHNALTPEIMKAVAAEMNAIKKDKSIRAVFISANGPSFCAGGDLNWMRKSVKFSLAQNMKDAEQLSKMYDAIFDCPVPVLAQIHGNVFGGGLGLIATCDIVAADENTKYCFSELKIGVVPSMIAPYVLRKMPEKDARLLFLTAEVFKSEKAVETGLVHFQGSKELCAEFINSRLEMIVQNAPEGTRITKELIHKVKSFTRVQSRALSIKTIAQVRVSKEGQEGLNSFFEKRSPSWK